MDSVIYRRHDHAIFVTPVRLYRRLYRRHNIEDIPVVTLGHRLLDNLLIQKVFAGDIRVADLFTPLPQTLDFPQFAPPLVVPAPRWSIMYPSMSYVLK
jgi:hypothetical protein